MLQDLTLCCCSWWKNYISSLFQTQNKAHSEYFVCEKTWNSSIVYIFFIFQTWNGYTTGALWAQEIHKMSFCLNNRYQMSQQVNYTSAACGLANSLCSILLRLIGRTFAFDVLLFALQDRAQAQLCNYIKVYQKKKKKTNSSSLATIVIFKKQRRNPPPKQHVYFYSSNMFLLHIIYINKNAFNNSIWRYLKN